MTSVQPGVQTIVKPSRTAPIRTAAEATPIAEANTGLMYAAMNHYRALWPNGDEDEALGIANLAYWRCCLAFDPAAGTLGTLVFSAVRNGLLRAARDAATAKRRPHSSAMPLAEWDRPTMAPADPPEPAWWMDLLLAEDLVICRLRAEGATLEGAGAAVGRSRTHAQHIMEESRAALLAAGVRPGAVPDRPRRHRTARATSPGVRAPSTHRCLADPLIAPQAVPS